MSGRARGTKRKADAAAAAAAAAEEPGAAAAAPASATGDTGTAATALFAIYITRKTKVVEYDEAAYDELDYNVDIEEGNDSVRGDLDAAACLLDGGRYCKCSEDASQQQASSGEVKGERARSGKYIAAAITSSSIGAARSDGGLELYESVEAAIARAVQVLLQEAKVVPEECELLPDHPAGAAAAAAAAAATAGARTTRTASCKGGSSLAVAQSSAAAAAAGGSMQDVGCGRAQWEREQVMKVAVWDFVNCIAVSKITVEVVQAQLQGRQA